MNTGLSNKQVIENRKKYGSNELLNEQNNSFIKLLLESLSDPIIKILLIALAIKTIFLFRDFNWFETLGIIIAIFFASFISSISEYGSEKAFERLQKESLRLKCKVIREGRVTEIFTNDVVYGDVILLESGEKVPADGIILSGKVSMDESAINGEAKEVIKTTNDTIYRGTILYGGKCSMLVKKVGMNTYYGKIASELSEVVEESPLKLRLRKLAKIISTFGYIGAALASFSYLFSVIVVDNGFELDSIIDTLTNSHLIINYIIYALTLCVTIIIVAVPEGLPMMITLVLSSNMKRMLKDNVLVRKMIGIETAGNINILYSDKTGTITTGKLTCHKIIDGALNEYKKESDLKDNTYLKILKTSMLVNNMSCYDGDKIIGGNTTDRCLLSFFKPNYISGINKLKEIPFDSNNKYMITVINDNNMRNLIKGAPEILLDHCKYFYNENGKRKIFLNKKKIDNVINDATKDGYRAIVLASSSHITETLFKDLVFVGVVLIRDKVRKEAKEAIKLVNDAGIHTVMITGDNKDTAVKIAEEIKLINSDDDIVLTSDELNNITDKDLMKIIPNLKVVARSLPQDKSRLVRVSQQMNLVVGMTGDGVNDAPALKKANVGFAFGSGTEVTKEASDIVILDNNFLSIARAVLFGRTIFKSIRKFIIFQLTINLCALLISIIGPFININTPITVIQMLWINMVMDTLAGLAFSFEPPLLEYMEEKPKKKKEGIINKYMVTEIVITGLYTTILFIIFLKTIFIRNLFNNTNSFLTAFFALFIFSSIFNLFNAHTSRINILSNLSKNKMFIIIVALIVIIQVLLIYYGGNMFRCTPLSPLEFIITIILSFSVVPVDILRKIICKKRGIKMGV